VFNSGTESFGNSSIFTFSFLLFALYGFLYSLFECDQLGGLVIFSWLCFQMDKSDYPHVTIPEDGWLCSMCQHRPGFPRVLYDALLHIGYNRDVLVYQARMSMAHSMDQCEESVTIPLNLTAPWMATIISTELDDTVEQMALVVPVSLCGRHLANTAATPIALFPTHCKGNPVCQQRLEAISNPWVLTSMQAWLRWPSMCNTRSTYSTPPLGLSSNSTCV
jgi:hypothetical protein